MIHGRKGFGFSYDEWLGRKVVASVQHDPISREQIVFPEACMPDRFMPSCLVLLAVVFGWRQLEHPTVWACNLGSIFGFRRAPPFVVVWVYFVSSHFYFTLFVSLFSRSRLYAPFMSLMFNRLGSYRHTYEHTGLLLLHLQQAFIFSGKWKLIFLKLLYPLTPISVCRCVVWYFSLHSLYIDIYIS